MTTRSKGPAAGFGWLTRGFSAGFRHPKPLLGGAAVLLIAAFLPTLVTLPLRIHAMQSGTPPNPVTSIGSLVFSMLIGLLLIPLYGGFLQLMDATEGGRAARVLDIFRPYRDGSALRLIGFGLLVLLLYVVIIGALMLTLGGGLLHWYVQMLGTQPQQPPMPPSLPHGFGVFFALSMVFALFMTGFYAIALGQVALSRRGVFASVGDGIVGAAKNVLPLLTLALGGLLAAIALAIAVIFVGMVVVLLGKLVGQWLVLVIAIPLYIALMMTVFVGGFGVSYHFWRDVCGPDEATAMQEPVTA